MKHSEVMTALLLGTLVIAMIGSALIPSVMTTAMATSKEEDNGNDDNKSNKNNDKANENSAVKTNDEDDDNEDEDEESSSDTTPSAEQNAADATGLQLSGTPTAKRSASTLSTTATANTDTFVPEYQRIIVTSAKTADQWLPILNEKFGTQNAIDPDGGDSLVIHFGSGQTPTSLASWVDMVKQVDGLTDNNIGFEFFSLAEIQQFAPAVASNGFGFISYDLEAGASPSNETSNPVAAFQSAKAAADAAGIELQAAPSRAITTTYGTQIAPLVTQYHIQSQALQGQGWTDSNGNPTPCKTMKDYVVAREQALRSANNALADHISFQVTFSPGTNNEHIAPGKTIYQTVTGCIQAVAPTPEDGGSIFPTSAAIINQGADGLAAAYTFYENGWSRNNPN